MLCESFVTAPVNITVKFPFVIDLNQVLIETCVGTRITCGLTISIQVERNPNPVILGKWFTNNEPVILLRNFFHEQTIPCILNDIVPAATNCFKGSLRCPKGIKAKSINSLTIRLLKVSPSGPPCIKGLKIFGEPSTSLGNQKEKIIKEWKLWNHAKYMENRNVKIVEKYSEVTTNASK